MRLLWIRLVISTLNVDLFGLINNQSDIRRLLQLQTVINTSLQHCFVAGLAHAWLRSALVACIVNNDGVHYTIKNMTVWLNTQSAVYVQ